MYQRIPANWRLAIYVFTGVVTPIITVLCSTEVHILPWWVGVIWAGEVTFATSLAGSNVGKPEEKEEV